LHHTQYNCTKCTKQQIYAPIEPSIPHFFAIQKVQSLLGLDVIVASHRLSDLHRVHENETSSFMPGPAQFACLPTFPASPKLRPIMHSTVLHCCPNFGLPVLVARWQTEIGARCFYLLRKIQIEKCSGLQDSYPGIA
jgi:hypothetical protein